MPRFRPRYRVRLKRVYTCVHKRVCVCVHTGTPEDPLADRWRMSEDPLAARWRMSEDSDSRHLADVTVKKEDSYYSHRFGLHVKCTSNI